MRRLILGAMLLLSAPAVAQNQIDINTQTKGTLASNRIATTLEEKILSLPIIGFYTVAGLPANVTPAGRIAVVTDASSAGSCTSGGGSEIALCRDSGTDWIPLGDGGGAGSGDNITVEDGDNLGTYTAIDTTAQFDDSGDINFAVADGGAGGPDTITATVRADSVALTTDTSGNYVDDVTAGTGIAVTHTPAEGSDAAVAFSFTDKGADPALGVDECVFTSNATVSGYLVCEGDTANTIETRIHVVDPTVSDKTFTIPNADSTAVQPDTGAASNFLTAISALGVISKAQPACADLSDSASTCSAEPTLGTNTSGNYVDDVVAGVGIAVTHTPAEGSDATVAFSFADAGADPALGVDQCIFTSNATVSGYLVCEGDTADTIETRIHVVDPTVSDKTFTIPNADSTAVQPDTGTASNFLTAISALGVISKAQPACSDLSDSGTLCTSSTDFEEEAQVGTTNIGDNAADDEVLLGSAPSTAAWQPLAGGALAYTLATNAFSTANCADLGDEGPGCSATSVYQLVDDEDTPLTQRATLNFEGAGVTCADDTDQTTCTIPGGGTSAWEDLTNSADSSTDYLSDNAAEVVDFQFQSAFTTGNQFAIRQNTGNPVGGTLFAILANDVNVTPLALFQNITGTVGLELEDPNNPANDSFLDSPTLRLTVVYDSDDTAGVTRAEELWTILGNATADAVTAVTSQLDFAVGGTAQASVKDTGVLDVLTGYTIGGAAATGNVLRGDGTNFISATLACADLSDDGSLCTASAVSGGAAGTITDNTVDANDIDETSAYAFSSTSNTFVGTSYTGPTADPADAGVLRLSNGETICWEASPTGADFCITGNSSEQIAATTFAGALVGNADTATTATTALAGDSIVGFFPAFTTAALATELSDEDYEPGDATSTTTALAENGAAELVGEALGTACTENQILKANATGGLDCGADNDSGGATAWNAIGDAAGDGSIDLVATEQDIVAQNDTADDEILEIINQDADRTADVTTFQISDFDQDDANAIYFRMVSDVDTTPRVDYEFAQDGFTSILSGEWATLTEGGNAVPNATDSLSFFTGSACSDLSDEGALCTASAVSGGAAGTITDNTVDANDIDETSAYAFSSTTNTFVGASYTSSAADPADVGIFRCGNNEACLTAELATPGADAQIYLDEFDVFQVNANTDFRQNVADVLFKLTNTSAAGQQYLIASGGTGSGFPGSFYVYDVSNTAVRLLLDGATYTDPADTGALRLSNGETICWEAAPTGTDFCITGNSSEQIAATTFAGALVGNADTATTATTATTANAGDSIVSFFPSFTTAALATELSDEDYEPGDAASIGALTVTFTNKTMDGGTATTTHAAGANFISTMHHATDCTAITDGKRGELCIEEDANTLYSCQPSAGDCDTAGEWILTGDGAGGGNSFGTIGAAVADSGADTITVSDGTTIDFTTTDNPEDLTAEVAADSLTASHINETGAFAWSSASNTFVGASYTGPTASPAGSGVLRLANAETGVCWESAPASTDVCMTADASEIIQISGGTLDAADLSGTVPDASINGANEAEEIDIDNLAGLTAIGSAFTMTNTTNTFVGASYTDGSGAAAGSGILRTANNVAIFGAEAAPAGIDGTLTFTAAEVMSFAGITGLNIPTGATYQINSVQIACANLSDAGTLCSSSTDFEEEAQLGTTNVSDNAAADQILRGTAANTADWVTLSNGAVAYNTTTDAFAQAACADLSDDGSLCDQSTVAAGQYDAASIDGDDVNSNIAGSGLVLTAASPDTLDVDLNATIDGTGLATSLSGMEFTATDELALLQGCTDGQVLKWDDDVGGNATWDCANDNDSGGAPAWEALVNTADTATSYVSNNTAETVTFDFQSAFTTGSQFVVKSSTGNPSGGNLVEIQGHDVNVVSFLVDGPDDAAQIQVKDTGGASTTWLVLSASSRTSPAVAEPYMGTITTHPFYFVTNNVYRWGTGAAGCFGIGGTFYDDTCGANNVIVEGGLSVGTSLTPTTGVINASVGFRVANAAASGNCLTGNGTNFVSTANCATSSSTNTFTEKTLNVESAGNDVTTVSKIWLDAAACNEGTASLNWDTPVGTGDTAPTEACNDTTNIQRPTASFDGSAVNSFERTIRLPSDWTGNIDLDIIYVATAAVPAGNVEFDVSTICRAVAETWDAAFNAAQTITDAQLAQNVINEATQATLTTTTCAADEFLTLKISRDGTNDTSNDAALMIGAEITLRRTQ